MQREPVTQWLPRHPWVNLWGIQPRGGCPSCTNYLHHSLPKSQRHWNCLPVFFPQILHLYLNNSSSPRSLQFLLLKVYQSGLQKLSLPLFVFPCRGHPGRLGGGESEWGILALHPHKVMLDLPAVTHEERAECKKRGLILMPKVRQRGGISKERWAGPAQRAKWAWCGEIIAGQEGGVAIC